VIRQPRDHGVDDRGEPPVPPDGKPAPHPVSRPALRGHVARRHLRPAADPPPRLPA
jgi:hypothetical protein